MSFDYSKLLGRMREKNITQEVLAERIGNTPSTLSLKLNNKAKFKQPEIADICKILDISSNLIGTYFFTIRA